MKTTQSPFGHQPQLQGNSKVIRFHSTAFLDLVCCGFGAAVLLFLIAVASVREDSDPTPDDTLLVCCSWNSGSKAEVGIELLPPGKTQWIRPQTCTDSVANYAVASGPNSGAETFVIVFEPTSGVWRFRPFLADFPDPGDASLEGARTSVTLKTYGRHLQIAEQAASVPMTWPGDSGQYVAVRVSK